MNENNNLPAVVNGSFFDKVKRFFSMLCRNDVTVSRTSEIFHMPVLAFIIVALLLWKISFIAILVSLFCCSLPRKTQKIVRQNAKNPL